MSLVRFALTRPYTIASAIALVCLLGVFAAFRIPTDIFPEINIPVVSVVWSYNGMSADDVQNRILTIHERQMASLVDDIQRIEANSYGSIGVIKVYLQEGADVSRAVSQIIGSAQVVLKYMPRNITPPLVLRYGATDVPIIQLSVSSRSLPDSKLNDLGQNTIRPALAVVQGASVPYPYGGKQRVIMVDLDVDAMHDKGVTPAEVSAALLTQNLIAPSGSVKMGTTEYVVALNNSSDSVEAINDFPLKRIGKTVVSIRDVAHVHDGFLVQTNAVHANGTPSSLMVVRKTGGASTLSVIDAIKTALPEIENLLPKDVKIEQLFDQSIFVRAALDSVLMGGLLAAGLTAIMILLFLGNWRLTLIILTSIPLSIVAAILVMYVGGQSLNTMTLGGFALAVGILVDNATVTIENIERNLALGKDIVTAIEEGSAEILIPTFVSTLAVCIVFVPVFLLKGTAKYLFTPLSLSVIISLLVSLILSFTLVPVLFKLLMKSYVAIHGKRPGAHDIRSRMLRNPFTAVHYGFDALFHAFRNRYQSSLEWAVRRPLATACFFFLLIGSIVVVFPGLGMDFFPDVDAGQMRLHVRAPTGSRIEETQDAFARVEHEIREIVGAGEVDTLLDNIGLPYSGINVALSDTATIGPMDGEVLISLKAKHHPTRDHVAALRRELPKKFPQLQFFFQPADIVNQVLNFGQPAPIDIRVTGPRNKEAYATASKILGELRSVPGIVDAHIFQVPDGPAMRVNVDRILATEMGITQRDVADNVLVTLSSSAMVAPNFWLSPANQVSYPLVVQTPAFRVDNMQDLMSMPMPGNTIRDRQMLMNFTETERGVQPLVESQVNIRPVFDIHADVQGSDLGSVASAIDKLIASMQPPEKSGIHVAVSGQVTTMRESFFGLASGIGLAVILVFLLMVMNFQSWIDPVIVLAAVPAALSGVAWIV